MKYINILSKSLIFLFLFMFVFSVYSSPQTLLITQETTPDKQPNSFYISRYDQREIAFNISTDYKKLSNRLEEPYIQASIKNLDSKRNIDFIISTEKIYFNKGINTSFFLKALPNNYKDTTTRVALSFSLYDEFDNLLDTHEEYFYFIANNSETHYLTETGKKPEFLGYNYSKNYLSFINLDDSFIVDVNFYVSSDYKYHLICTASEELNLHVVSNTLNNYKINVFLNKEKFIEDVEEKLVINCVAKDKYETHELKSIPVVVHISQEVIEELEETSFLSGFDISKLTGFFNISFFEKVDLKSVLVVVIVIMILSIIFYKK